MPSPPEAGDPPPVVICPQCEARCAADQNYCLECGHRLVDMPPSMAAADGLLEARRRPPLLPMAVIVALILLAAGAVAAYALTRDDGKASKRSTSTTVEAAAPGPPASPTTPPPPVQPVTSTDVVVAPTPLTSSGSQLPTGTGPATDPGIVSPSGSSVTESTEGPLESTTTETLTPSIASVPTNPGDTTTGDPFGSATDGADPFESTASTTEPTTTDLETPPTTTSDGPTTPGTPGPPVNTIPTTTRPSGGGSPPGSTGDGGTSGDWPAGRTAYTIIALSSGSRAAAERFESRLTAAGLSAGLTYSSDFTNLRPGYWIVYSGVYDTLARARSGLAAVRAVKADAYTRHMVPA